MREAWIETIETIEPIETNCDSGIFLLCRGKDDRVSGLYSIASLGGWAEYTAQRDHG